MKQKTALLFDDNEMCRTLMTAMLTEKQFQVVAFSDPISFLSQQEKTCCHRVGDPCFDIMITDKNMPGMTGLEFLEQLKGFDCKLPDRRKAIISGHWTDTELSRAKQLGCKVFYKPEFMDDVFAWLDEFE
jgi:CheY-like chemotaxis protein